MSRALDRLIQNRSRTSRSSHYGRDFRTSYYSEAIGKITAEMIETLKGWDEVDTSTDDHKIPEGWDEVDTSTDDRRNPEGWDEVDTAPGESEGYRYRLLPKIFSNVREIYSSPKLRRQLIQYYLKNRRKERMRYRGYSRRMRQLTRNGQISADYFIHNMYMELGRIMYFSMWSKVWNGLKIAWNKIKCGAKWILEQLGFPPTLAVSSILSGGLSYTLIEFLNQKWLKVLAFFTSESIRLGTDGDASKTAAAVLGFGFGLIFTGMLSLLALAAKNCESKGEGKPIEAVIYASGNDILIDALTAITPMTREELGQKKLDELIALVADYIPHDNPKKLSSIFDIIANKIKASIDEPSKVNNYFPGMGTPDELLKVVERFQDADDLIFEWKVDSDFIGLIKTLSKGRLNPPNTIQFPNSKETIKEISKNLPGILTTISFLTSPSVDVKTVKNRFTLTFKSQNYFRDFGGVQQKKVIVFLKTFLQDYYLKEADKLNTKTAEGRDKGWEVVDTEPEESRGYRYR